MLTPQELEELAEQLRLHRDGLLDTYRQFQGEWRGAYVLMGVVQQLSEIIHGCTDRAARG